MNFLSNFNNAKVALPLITFAGACGFMICKHEISNFIAKLNEYNQVECQKDEVKQWMYKNQVNSIIDWKNNNIDDSHNYIKFVKETFPENIKMEKDKIIWIDERVLGKHWKGVFDNIKPSDKKYTLDNPPGTSELSTLV